MSECPRPVRSNWLPSPFRSAAREHTQRIAVAKMSTFTATKVLDARLNAKTVIRFRDCRRTGRASGRLPADQFRRDGGYASLCMYFFRWCRQQMEWWQMLVLLALTPSLILNYGFDNFAVGAGGLKFPVGDLLMFLALILVAWRFGQSAIKEILLDPPVACLMALLLMTFCHLLFNVPRYGFYAVRDASMFFESVILILGVTVGAKSAEHRTAEALALLRFPRQPLLQLHVHLGRENTNQVAHVWRLSSGSAVRKLSTDRSVVAPGSDLLHLDCAIRWFDGRAGF